MESAIHSLYSASKRLKMLSLLARLFGLGIGLGLGIGFLAKSNPDCDSDNAAETDDYAISRYFPNRGHKRPETFDKYPIMIRGSRIDFG
jgi:hypothetical protein